MRSDFIEVKCRQCFQIIEDRVRLIENKLQNIDHMNKEKVKQEIHVQLSSHENNLRR